MKKDEIPAHKKRRLLRSKDRGVVGIRGEERRGEKEARDIDKKSKESKKRRDDLST